MTIDEVFEQYRSRFGAYPSFPPFDLGHVNISIEELTQYAAEALEAGEPINWEQRLDPLPDGAKS